MQNRILLWLRALAWQLFACWVAGIIALSSLSGEKIDPLMLHVLGWDKICHAFTFGCGTVVLAFGLWKSTNWPLGRILLGAVVAISIFGMTDEWHQLYTPGRSGADVWDWLADTAGATLAAFATYAGSQLRKGAFAHRPVTAGD